MNSILKRRSIRKYLNDSIPDGAIRQILEAAMCAPSAGNQRPWHFVVVKEKSLLEKLSGTSPYSGMLKNAPLCILVCGDLKLEIHKSFWVQDCSAATENILLEAVEKGLGAVWLGVYPLDERIVFVRNVFSFPENIVPFALIPMGYPAETKETKSRFDESRVHIDRW